MSVSEMIDDQIFAPSREPNESPQEASVPLSHTKFGASHMPADTPVIDLVFAMDCTISMEGHIQDAINTICQIIGTIVSTEIIDCRFALIEYRDHPPQERTFVTRRSDFTNSAVAIGGWLNQCRAEGGGNAPEAVADALYDALTLPWRSEAAKICIIIADAPPHGINPAGGDTFPDGCPCGHDPLMIAQTMAAKNIILYTVGVEPSVELYVPYFTTLAQLTRGQYVSLVNAPLLAQIIIDGVCERSSQAT